MAGVETSSVGDTKAVCSGHEEPHTAIVLGGSANIIHISFMQCPTGMDGGAVVDKTFCAKGRDGCFVIIEGSVDLFVGRLGGIMAGEMKEVERQFGLRYKIIPKLQGAVLVDSGEPCNEVLLESCDGALSGVDPMVVRGNKVNVHVIFASVCFDSF